MTKAANTTEPETSEEQAAAVDHPYRLVLACSHVAAVESQASTEHYCETCKATAPVTGSFAVS